MSTSERTNPTNPVVADSAPRVVLVVRKGGEVGQRIPCRHVVTFFGSREGCKVNLRHERVGPVHAAIVNDGARVAAVDLLSPHGTRVNGLQLQLETLRDGDTIALERWEFRVEIEEPPPDGHADVHPFDLEPAPQAVALEHVGSGRILQPTRNVCLFGRRHGCDIVISDGQVSRAHALLISYFDRPAIVDLLTPNHTFVNDVPCSFQVLKDGDVIGIGESRFCIRLVESKVVKQAAKNNGNHKAAAGSVTLSAASEKPPDLIDIQTTEEAEPWSIADHLDELEKSGGRR